MRRRTFASCAFKKRAPNSASAAEAATSLRIVHVMCTAPFNEIGLPSLGTLPRKKNPPARLRALGALRYEASECILRTMSDALYLILAIGCVAM